MASGRKIYEHDCNNISLVSGILKDVELKKFKLFQLDGTNGCELRLVLARAIMEYNGISSYRAIVANTTAILNSPHARNGRLIGSHEPKYTALDHRLYQVAELVRTEREYVAMLQTVLENYAEPCRKFTSLSVEDHKILFVGLEPIVSLCAMLVSKLDDAIDSWDPASTKVGNLFSSKFWNHYNYYAESYSAIEGTLEENKGNDRFEEFLELRRGNSDLTLKDLLQLPIQRIPEYDKYLNELLQETDPGHPDYDHLSRAAAKVRQMVKEREDELGNMDHQKSMERIQDKFPYDDLQLRNLDLQRRQLASRRKSAPGAVLFKTLGKTKSANNILSQSSMGKKDAEFFRPRQYNNFNRQYLMEGIVEFSRGMQTQDRYLFLFSDLLLVAKQKSNTTFKLKHRIRVCELWIADCVDVVTELTRTKETSFVIGWPTTNYVATFKSVELKDTWLIKFKEQIQEERSKLLPKTLPLEVHCRDTDNKVCTVEVETTTDVQTIVKHCLEQLALSEKDEKDYQLWVRLGPDESPYPLCGHELPYAIKLNHIRDFGKRTEDNMTEIEIQRIMNEMQTNNRKYEFFLKTKKSQKRHSLDESSANVKPSKGRRKFTIFRKNRDDKKAQGKLFGRPLADITSDENLIAKPVKELLTILFREGPYTMGILRKSCNAKTSKELRQKLDDGEDCLTGGESWPPLVIGALVKDYLRSIPKSLLQESLFDDWIAANSLTDPEEKNNKVKDTVGKLTRPHYELLRHLMCVLYHIDKKSDENKMTAYNLSVCIAPSLLWPKGNPDPLMTPPAILQYMIINCQRVFGEDSIYLFGDIVEQKMRQDSSTDSDSMHSVLSSHSNFRRDDSSIDSLDREVLYSGEMDSSPSMGKLHHFSPSNLSGDSGLISDSQFYDEDGNGNELNDHRNYMRSNSQFINRELSQEELDPQSRSLESQYFYQYDPKNPVPPPRRTRRKGSDPSNSPNMEYDRKPTRFTSQANFHLPNRYDKKFNQNAEKYKRRSTESLKSVEESSEADSEINMKNYQKQDIGTLIKSASGAHLYFEELNNCPTLFEFNNMNRISNRRQLYKQASEGAMPMSPQSKYSLSSSRDSVLSDSSGSYLNRQNSPDPLSSSAETPDQEDRGMSEWLSQQSKHVAYTCNKQSRISQDDSEVGVKIDHKPSNKLNYLVSPKTSPKLRRRSPIPLEARRSFPLQPQLTPKGSGSNTSKEAEDIIKSPKLTVTYCSQDSLDKRAFDTAQSGKPLSPHLDVYNNNSQTAMKQLNIYSNGLQGTSPPPRVVLQGLGSQGQQSQRREATPMKGNHSLLSKRRNSFDSAEFIEHKQRYPMEENSVSSEDEGEESDYESEIESFRVQTIINVPLKFDIPQKRVVEHQKSASDSSSVSDDSNINRPVNPPNYQEAMQRNMLLKQGLSPDNGSDLDNETMRQREVSLKAKQLFEKSMRLYHEKELLPSQKFEQKLDSHEEELINSSSEDEQPEYSVNPARKYYEESLKRYQEEQKKQPPLSKVASEDRDNISISKNKGGQQSYTNSITPHGSSINRSCSDVGDVQSHLSRSSSGSSRTSSNDSTPTRRPTQPPPYNDPPPYRSEYAESSPRDVKRHLFPRASENIGTQNVQNSSPHTVSNISTSKSAVVCSNDDAQTNSIPTRRDNILVSNRARNGEAAQRLENLVRDSMMPPKNTDYSVKSAQTDSSQYRSPVTNIRSRDNSLDSSKVTNVSQSMSENVFRTRPSSVEPKQPLTNPSHPRTSSQGPVSYRNPNMLRSSAAVARSQPQPQTNRDSERRMSFDTAVTKNSTQKELPWSVKNLSNIFDTSRNGSVSARSSPVVTNMQPVQGNVPPPYTPPPAFQRCNDTIRSSTSSNSSMGSASTGRSSTAQTPVKHYKYGPQARDSFSSADESDCSCRYSLNCRRDNLEEITDISLTDITYV